MALPAWLEDMDRDVKELQSRSSGGEKKRWSLYGKAAIVAPGETVPVRFLPHSHIKMKVIKDKKSGKMIKNENYQPKRIYEWLKEHWYDGPDGNRAHAWCNKSFDPKAKCFLCDESDTLRESKDEQEGKAGYNMRAKDTFCFNAVLGPTGDRRLREDGRPDIRMINLPGTLFEEVYGYMTGSGNESFARGDISDPVEGFDILLKRPVAGAKNARWSADCAPKPTRLYSDAEKEAWGRDWPELIYDIQKEVEKELKTYDEQRAFYLGEEAPARAAETSGKSDADDDDADTVDADAADDVDADADETGEEEAEAGVEDEEDPFAGFGVGKKAAATTKRPAQKKK